MGKCAPSQNQRKFRMFMQNQRKIDLYNNCLETLDMFWLLLLGGNKKSYFAEYLLLAKKASRH